MVKIKLILLLLSCLLIISGCDFASKKDRNGCAKAIALVKFSSFLPLCEESNNKTDTKDLDLRGNFLIHTFGAYASTFISKAVYGESHFFIPNFSFGKIEKLSSNSFDPHSYHCSPLLDLMILNLQEGSINQEDNVLFQKVLRYINCLPDSNTAEQLISFDQTFIAIWMGNNRLLKSAFNGLKKNPKCPLFFEGIFSELMLTLQKNTDDKIIVANIPYISSLPYFTSVTLGITNGKPLYGRQHDSSVVEIGAEELILLPAGIEISNGMGLTREDPLPNNLWISKFEKKKLDKIVDHNNRIIETVAFERGFLVLDINTIFADIADGGAKFYGIEFSKENTFKSDLRTLSALASRLVSNKFIEVINDSYAKNKKMKLIPWH